MRSPSRMSPSAGRRGTGRALRLVLMLAVLAAAVWGAAPADAADSTTRYYVSVGDSLAQGFQPIGGPHTNSSAAGYTQGYADQLFKLAREGGRDQLRLVKFGCGGESTATMIADSRCDYETGSQLGDAVAFLDAHPGEIAFITINLGANDLLFDCPDPACAVQQVQTNLPVILDALRQAAGPDVPIVGMNYANPFVAEWFFDPAAGEAVAAFAVGYNDVLEAVYAAAGVPVADVATAFAMTDFTTMVELKGFGPVPLSVFQTCTLTWICTTGPPSWSDIHPNTDGYARIAETFAAVLGS